MDCGSKMPILVGRVDGRTQLVPWRKPKPVQLPLSRLVASREEKVSDAAVMLPISQLLLDQERPRSRGMGQQASTRTGADVVRKVPEALEPVIKAEGHPTVCAELRAHDACNGGCLPSSKVHATAQLVDTSTTACLSTSPACPSVGSLGHPYCCADACKFHTKRRGCKDGASCERCHLCYWTVKPKTKVSEAR